MLTVTPDYYKNFNCIADKCKHNCCIGWEIDIDKDTYLKYKSLNGVLQKKFQKCITANDSGATFILTEKERCPFLNQNGLCEIIIDYGFDYLSEICSEHPRFVNFFSDRTEKGLGLCCEAAADLIVKYKDIATLCTEGSAFETKQETEFFEVRQNILQIIQNRKLTISERKNKLCDIFKLNTHIDKLNLIKFMKSLEILDNKWEKLLQLYEESIKSISTSSLQADFPIVYEQIFVYFIYRHLSEAIYDERFRERLLFSFFSCEIIFDLCALKNLINNVINIDDFVDVARMYSSEIEYSEENTENFINYFSAF